jgi:Na+-driven multidrug efflux pump
LCVRTVKNEKSRFQTNEPGAYYLTPLGKVNRRAEIGSIVQALESMNDRAKIAPFLRVADPPTASGLGRILPRAKLARQVLRLAVPVMIGMLTQNAITVADTVMVGHLPRDLANPGQAAIGLCLPLLWVVGGSLSALWVGTQALTSRRAGEGDLVAAGRVLTSSLALALLVAVSLAPSLSRTYRYYRLASLDARVLGAIARLSLPNAVAAVVVMTGFAAFYWVVDAVNARHAPAGNPVLAAANQGVIAIAARACSPPRSSWRRCSTASAAPST